MKILQLCNKPPLPKIDGGCVAISNISEGLIAREDIELKILTVETYKHPFITENYPDSFIKKTSIEAVYIDTKVNFVDAYSSIITSDSYNVIRFFSPSFDKRLREILEQSTFDIIHIESIFLTPYIHTIRKYSKAKIVLRAHNIEHNLWEKWKDNNNFLKRWYLKHLHNKLKKYETAILNNIDGIVAISNPDAEQFAQMVIKPIHVTPVGISIINSESEHNYPKTKVFHIGAMDWAPNKQAIDWFIDKVWPKVLKSNPKMELHLAGKQIKIDEYHIPKLNIYCHGEVESASDFIKKHDIMVVPIRIGSGIRIKILEAMSMGKVVISSKTGISGINAQNEKEFLSANNSDEFANQIIKASNIETYNLLAKNAQLFIDNNYKKETIIQELVSFYQSLL